MAAHTGRARLAGVIGHPVGHSLSPALHEFWLRHYDIDGAYIPLDCAPEHFEETVLCLSRAGFRGFNITIPYKERAFALASTYDESATLTGAVNTLVRMNDGSFYGKNTDVSGFLANLRENGVDLTRIRHAVVLGAGGAARGVAVGLLLSGCTHLTFINRTHEKSLRLIEQLAPAFPSAQCSARHWEERHAALEGADLLVNTTQLGMRGQPALDISLAALPRHAVVADIVYNPLKTPLLEAAEQAGYHTVSGLGMLLHQAAPGFEAWFGVKPEVTAELHLALSRLLPI